VCIALLGALGCEDGETDPCPQIKAGGGKVTPVVATGTAPVASGGALVAGTFNLSKLDVVLSQNPSAEGRLHCEALSAVTQQNTLRVTPRSATEGTLLSLSVGDDGNGILTEQRSGGGYVSAGSTLTISVSGNVCETMLVPQSDGGIGQTRTVENKESTPQSQAYTSADSTLTFFATLDFGGAPDCVVVSTYLKQ
jgi:hypothetical protein